MRQTYVFHERTDDYQHLDVQPLHPKKIDEQVKSLIAKNVACNTVEAFQRLDQAQRREMLDLLKNQNASYRQISRLTGGCIGII